MPLDLAAIQLFLPMALLVWLALAPTTSIPSFWLQSASIALAIFAAASAGVWLLPPWWTPHAFGVLWAAISIFRERSRKHAGLSLPRNAKAWLSFVASAALFAVSAGAVRETHQGASISAKAIDLASPLRGGPYFVTSGGSTALVNAHVETLSPRSERMSDYRGQSYGVDIVKLDSFGLRAAGLRPRDPAAYFIFGEPVYAPCRGIVVDMANDLPDLKVPETDREHMAGNHVLLQCGDAQVLLAHMQHDSVNAQLGQTIEAGAQIGAVGNSGNTGEPHLHIHAQERGTIGAPLSGTPMQIRINGKFLVRNDRFSARGEGSDSYERRSPES